MDSLTYYYNDKTNQLNYISDNIASTNYTTDIDNQSPNNYAYDSIGNLIQVASDGVTNMQWTVYGKLKKAIGLGFSQEYVFDANNNRVIKIGQQGSITGKQYYIRDAQGNILASYSYDGTSLKWNEQDLYGSSRIGLWSWNKAIPSRVMLPQSETDTLTTWYLLGGRYYELTNHLGNVLSVITDKKKGVSLDSATVDHYQAEVLSQNDYYPFGMEQPGRSFRTIPYPYAFNGKRMENVELSITNIYDYGMRSYDARIGRFYSVDPLTSKYPELTPYQFASNTPIQAVDLDGEEVENAFYRIKRWALGITSLKMNNANSIFGDIQQQNYTVSISNPTRSTKDLQYRMATNINSIFGTGNGSFKFAKQQEKGKITKGDYITINPGWKGFDIAVKVANVTNFKNNKIGIDLLVKGFSITFRTLQGHFEVGSITFTALQFTNPQTGGKSFEFNIFSTSQIDNGVGSVVAPYSRKLQQQVWGQVLKNVATFMGGSIEDANQIIDTYKPSDFNVIKNNETTIGVPKRYAHPKTEVRDIKIKN
jgi:RHS repeat-associated protein